MISLILAGLVRLVFTVGPGHCLAYLVEANTGSGWFTKNAYVDSLMTAPKIPSIAEADSEHVDHLWVSLSTAGGGTSLRCRCIGGEVSNVLGVVPAHSYARDTTLYLWQGERVAAVLGGGTREARAVFPDSSALLIETLDAEQARRRADHCRACGYWWQHGIKEVCP